MSWWSIIKAPRGISPRSPKSNRKPARGTTIEGNTYEACTNRILMLYSQGKIDIDEYVKRKKECDAKFGK